MASPFVSANNWLWDRQVKQFWPTGELESLLEAPKHGTGPSIHLEVVLWRHGAYRCYKWVSESRSVMSDSLPPIDYIFHGILQAKMLECSTFTPSSFRIKCYLFFFLYGSNLHVFFLQIDYNYLVPGSVEGSFQGKSSMTPFLFLITVRNSLLLKVGSLVTCF